MLSSDKHPSACSELTKALAAPRCLIKPTTNNPRWVQSRGEQPNQGCKWRSTLLGEGRVGGSRTRRDGGKVPVGWFLPGVLHCHGLGVGQSAPGCESEQEKKASSALRDPSPSQSAGRLQAAG